jgi:hypothetical protein
MRFWLLVVLAALVSSTQLPAAPPDNPVMLRIGDIPAVKAQPGDTVFVTVPVHVARGYHVNANPAASEDYIPLEVKLDSTADVYPGMAVYPRGGKWRLEGTTEDLLVYAGDITVKIPLVVKHGAKTGKRELSGTLDYQACNNQVCFLPESRPIAVTLEIIETK